MNPNRTAAFYSRGPHFVRMLQALRARHPEDHISAWVPVGYPMESIQPWVDEIIEIDAALYSLRNPGGLLRLRRQLAAGNYQRFVVMFDSVKLRLLAAASGAPERYCHGPDGRYLPLSLSLPSVLFRALSRRIMGTLRYAYIRHVVYHQPVPQTEIDRMKAQPPNKTTPQ